MRSNLSQNATLGGAVAAAFAASACCLGPLVFALLGIGGAGALIALEPYRPVFVVVTVLLLSYGWYLAYRAPQTATGTQGPQGVLTVAPVLQPVATGDECGCEMPKANRAGKRMLWGATGLAVVALAFPYLTPYLF